MHFSCLGGLKQCARPPAEPPVYSESGQQLGWHVPPCGDFVKGDPHGHGQLSQLTCLVHQLSKALWYHLKMCFPVVNVYYILFGLSVGAGISPLKVPILLSLRSKHSHTFKLMTNDQFLCLFSMNESENV